jgi:hypothetical protein
MSTRKWLSHKAFIAPTVSNFIERTITPRRAPHTSGPVRQLAAFLKRSPDTATEEDLRLFQLHMVDRVTSPIAAQPALLLCQ